MAEPRPPRAPGPSGGAAAPPPGPPVAARPSGTVGPGPPVPWRVAEALRAAATPVCAYVYDRAVLRERVAALRAALPAGVELLYAVKANGHPEVVGTLAAVTDGLEVASGGELELALAATGMAATGTAAGAREIAFSGPGKTDAELAAAHAAGALLHVESPHELRRVPAGARVAIRVNRAGGGLPGSHAMAGAPTAFGVDEAALPELFAAVPSGVDVLGFHLHAASNLLDAAAHARFAREAVDWAVRAAAAHRVNLRYLNLGGGLGVDYTGARELDLTVLGDGMRVARAGLPARVRLVLEPGRFLTADAGWYAAQVLDLKHTHGRWFAVVRGGTHHFRLPAAWGYSHPCALLPVDDWPYPFDRPEVREAAVDVVGELCTPRDVLAAGRWTDRLRVGDVLVFGRTGGYGWDISHHGFLRHAYPQMIFI